MQQVSFEMSVYLMQTEKSEGAEWTFSTILWQIKRKSQIRGHVSSHGVGSRSPPLKALWLLWLIECDGHDIVP